jgi:phage recombination protein Bet
MSDENALAVAYKTADGEDVQLTPDYVNRFVLTGNGQATDAEIAGFMAKVKAAGANPLAGDAVLQKWGDNPATTIFTEKFFKSTVQSQPDYDGMEHGIIVINSQGVVERRVGTIYTDTEALVGGWCRIYSKERAHPVDVDVAYSEVVQTRRDGKVNAIWSKQPARMVEKCATTKAAREFCPSRLGAAYDSDEVTQEQPAQNVTVESGPELPATREETVDLTPVRSRFKAYTASIGLSPDGAMDALCKQVGASDMQHMTPEQVEKAVALMDDVSAQAAEYEAAGGKVELADEEYSW